MDEYLLNESSFMKEFPEFRLESINWNYIGEGGRHLVITLPAKGLALRFCKYSDKENISEADECKKYSAVYKFHYFLMVPLLGRIHSVLPLIGKIPANQVNILNSLIVRPQSFKKKSNIRFGFVEIYPDNTQLSDIIAESSLLGNSFITLVSSYLNCLIDLVRDVASTANVTKESDFPVIAIEIKPKQGWIPLSERKFPKCIFCMNQYSKLLSGAAVEISKYCPLDLFSGDSMRMTKAIKNLIETPQNNLRIYRNGKVIYGDSINSADYDINELLRDDGIDKLSELIVQALQSDFGSDIVEFIEVEPSFFREESYLAEYNNLIKTLCHQLLQVGVDNSGSWSLCNWSYQQNRKNTILDKILYLQKLDQVGLEDVYNYYRLNYSVGAANFKNYNYTERLFTNRSSDNIHDKLSLNMAECYALASVAKDCSIFITLQKSSSLNDRNANVLRSSDEVYQFKIALTDIGPKPLTCIDKHVQRNIDFIKNCSRYFNLM